MVIDAGSTGSRVLGFKFHRDGSTGALKLDDELWVQDKPGLSSHADSPRGAADSISKLLAEAKAWLPDGYSQIFKIACVWPFGLLDYGSATLRCKI